MAKPLNPVQDHPSLSAGEAYFKPIDFPDAINILKVYAECEDFLSLGPEPKASLEMVLGDMRFVFERGGIYSGIYTANHVLAGVLSYFPSGYRGDPDVAFIELLMIASPFRRTGLGTEIVRRLEMHLRQSYPIHIIRAAVQVNNSAGICFWERMGYQIDGEPELQPDGTTTYPLIKSFE